MQMSMNEQLDNQSAEEQIKSVVNQSQKLVSEIIAEIDHLAAEFRLGFTPQLSLEFDECLSGIQTLMSTMITLQFISKENEALKERWSNNYSIWQNTEPLFKSSLNAMLKAYGHEDYLALADVMEEELVESLQSWQKFVEKLA